MLHGTSPVRRCPCFMAVLGLVSFSCALFEGHCPLFVELS